MASAEAMLKSAPFGIVVLRQLTVLSTEQYQGLALPQESFSVSCTSPFVVLNDGIEVACSWRVMKDFVQFNRGNFTTAPRQADYLGCP